MPMYPYKCPKCKIRSDVSCLMVERNNQRCACGGGLERDWSRNTISHVDQTLGYYDEGLDCYIGSTSDRRKVMKERKLEAFTGSRTAKEQMKPYFDLQKKERTDKKREHVRHLISSNISKMRR